MAWIESHQSLLSHKKLLKMTRKLGIIKYQAIGHLQALWWWSIDNAADGDLSGQTPEIIAEAAGWKDHHSWWHELQAHSPTECEKVSDLEFFNILVECGWIDGEQISPNGEQKNLDIPLPEGTRLHDWLEYCGDLVKKRLERQIENKAKSRTLQDKLKTGNKSPPTVPYRTLNNIDILNKERKYKERNTEKIKNSYGEFDNVLLTENEYQKLIDKLGKDKTDDFIEQLSGYMRQNPKNARKYTDHYATILNWSRMDGRQSKATTNEEVPWR